MPHGLPPHNEWPPLADRPTTTGKEALDRILRQTHFAAALIDFEGNLVQSNARFHEIATSSLASWQGESLAPFFGDSVNRFLEDYREQLTRASNDSIPSVAGIVTLCAPSGDNPPWPLDLFARDVVTGPHFLLADASNMRVGVPERISRAADTLLEDISDIIVQLVAADNEAEIIDSLLESIGTATGVDRVYLQRTKGSETHLTNLWFREGLSYPDGGQMAFAYRGVLQEDPRQVLPSPEVQTYQLAELPPLERFTAMLMESYASLMYPIFVNQEVWGEIGFSNTAPISDWPAAHRHALKLFGAALGAVAGRSVARNSLAESQRRMFHLQKLEALGRLAGGVAHEFNNSLAGIIGHAHLLEEEMIAQPVCHDYLEAILRSGQRASEVVKSMLVFSRKPATDAPGCEANATLRDFYPLLRGTLTEDVEISMVLGESDKWWIRPTRGQFEQVLMNLAVNASHAMERGGVLRITALDDTVEDGDQGGFAEHSLAPGPYVRIEVADNGSGMPANVIEHAFEPFFTTKQVGAGLGLGLSVVHEIVVAAQGTVEIESKEGEGTTFILRLPLVEGKAEDETEDSEMFSGSESVLVVDDEPLVLRTTVHYLELMGYAVTGVSSADEAIRHLESGVVKPDLLLVDLVMPGMGGMELSEWVRENHGEIPVLFMTGYFAPQSQDIESLQPRGGGLLCKPFTSSELGKKVRTCLEAAAG